MRRQPQTQQIKPPGVSKRTHPANHFGSFRWLKKMERLLFATEPKYASIAHNHPKLILPVIGNYF